MRKTIAAIALLATSLLTPAPSVQAANIQIKDGNGNLQTECQFTLSDSSNASCFGYVNSSGVREDLATKAQLATLSAQMTTLINQTSNLLQGGGSVTVGNTPTVTLSSTGGLATSALQTTLNGVFGSATDAAASTTDTTSTTFMSQTKQTNAKLATAVASLSTIQSNTASIVTADQAIQGTNATVASNTTSILTADQAIQSSNSQIQTSNAGIKSDADQIVTNTARGNSKTNQQNVSGLGDQRTFTLASAQTLAAGANSTPVTVDGSGVYNWAYIITGTTPTLGFQVLGPDGTTWLDVIGSSGSALVVAANGSTQLQVMGGASGAQVRLINKGSNSLTTTSTLQD